MFYDMQHFSLTINFAFGSMTNCRAIQDVIYSMKVHFKEEYFSFSTENDLLHGLNNFFSKLFLIPDNSVS